MNLRIKLIRIWRSMWPGIIAIIMLVSFFNVLETKKIEQPERSVIAIIALFNYFITGTMFGSRLIKLLAKEDI